MRHDIGGIIFDVDGTLIREISWMNLNLGLGVTKSTDQRLFDEYHDGKFSYQQWIDQVVKIYKERGPVKRSQIEQILLNYTLSAGAVDTIEALKDRGYHIGIVSGGLDVVVSSVAKKVGVARCYTAFNSKIVYNRCGNLDKMWLVAMTMR